MCRFVASEAQFPEQSWCFSQCQNKPGSWCPAGWRLVIHHCNTCPATGLSLPILQGHLSLGPALTSELLRSMPVPWGVAEGFLRSHLNETFAGALDPQRQAGELPSKQIKKKKSSQRGIASYIVHSLPSPTVQMKKRASRKQPHTHNHFGSSPCGPLSCDDAPRPIPRSRCFPYLPWHSPQS